MPQKSKLSVNIDIVISHVVFAMLIRVSARLVLSKVNCTRICRGTVEGLGLDAIIIKNNIYDCLDAKVGE